MSNEKARKPVTAAYAASLTEVEAALFATSLQKVAAVAFAALGLDMSGLVSVEESLAPDDRSAGKK